MSKRVRQLRMERNRRGEPAWLTWGQMPLRNRASWHACLEAGGLLVHWTAAWFCEIEYSAMKIGKSGKYRP